MSASLKFIAWSAAIAPDAAATSSIRTSSPLPYRRRISHHSSGSINESNYGRPVPIPHDDRFLRYLHDADAAGGFSRPQNVTYAVDEQQGHATTVLLHDAVQFDGWQRPGNGHDRHGKGAAFSGPCGPLHQIFPPRHRPIGTTPQYIQPDTSRQHEVVAP